MIKRSTEPRNKDFFSRVVPVIPYVILAGIIFQVISAITEAFGIYQFGDVLGTPLFVNLFFTIIVVIGWELLIRVSTEYIFKTVTLKLRKEIVLENLEFVLLFLAILLGGPLIYYSYSVSKENAHMTFEFMMPEKDTMVVSSIVQTKKADIAIIGSDYQERKTEIENRFAERIAAAKGVHDANKSTNNALIREWRAKEKQNDKKYTTYINRYKNKINESNQAYQLELKELSAQMDNELAELKNWRYGVEDNASTLANNFLQNDKDKWITFKAWFEKYAYIWAHFAGLSSILAVMCVIFSVVFKVLAGIEDETHLTPESLEPKLLSELSYLLHLKTISPLRNKIRTAINNAALKRVQLEIVTHSTPSVTHSVYTPPPVTPIPVTVTEPVTQIGYASEPITAKHPLPTTVTSVTDYSEPVTLGGAVAVPLPVTKPEAVIIELDPTVTAKTPKRNVAPVTDQLDVRIVMVGQTTAKIDRNGKVETVTLEVVRNRKRAQKGNMKNRKTDEAKLNAEKWYSFYCDLEDKMTAK